MTNYSDEEEKDHFQEEKLGGIPDEEDYGDAPVRRSASHMPNVFSQTPNYSSVGNPSASRNSQIDSLFDDQGRPIISLSIEIAPTEDHPFWFPMQVCESITHSMLKGDAVWPLNIKNNPYLFYWLGKKKKYLTEDLLIILILSMMPIFFLLLSGAADFFGYSQLKAFAFVVTAFVATAFVSATGYRFSSSLLDEFSKTSTREEFLMTRLTSADLTYGFLARLLSPFVMGMILSILAGFFVVISGVILYILLGDVLNLTAMFSINALVSMLYWLFVLYGLFVLNLCIGVHVFHKRMAPKRTEIPRQDGETGTIKVLPIPYIAAVLVIILSIISLALPLALLFFISLIGFFVLFIFGSILVLLIRQHNACLQILIWHLKKPLGEFLRIEDSEPLERKSTSSIKF